jgi:hypothetical protein
VSELSALVVLRPAGGGDLGARAPITSETVSASLPSQDAISLALGHFQGRGFGVTAPVGASFSIVAPREQFEREFRVRLDEEKLAQGLELSLQTLPANVASVVQAVVFTPPPDFGPTDFH